MKISIITASYNYEHYIKKSIESILCQTYTNWELIIVDDGSKDNSVSIIKEYCRKYPDKIFLYKHESSENKGLSQTLQLGLKKANGKYIAFLESDDYWTENHLEEKINVIKNNSDVKFIFNATKLFGDEDVVKEHYIKTADNIPIEEKNDSYDFMPFVFLEKNIVGTFSSMFIDKKVIAKCDFNSIYDPYLDWWICHQIALKYKMYYLNKQLTFWRLHKKSYTKEKFNKKNQKKIENYYQKMYKNYIKRLFLLKIDFDRKIKMFLLLCFKLLIVPRFLNKIFRGSVMKFQNKIINSYY